MTVTDTLQSDQRAHRLRARRHGRLAVLGRLCRRLRDRRAVPSARPLAAFEQALARIEACAARPERAGELPQWTPLSLIEHVHASPGRVQAHPAEACGQPPGAISAALEKIVAEMNAALLAGADELRCAADLGDADGAGMLARALAGYLRGLLAHARAVMDGDIPPAP